ncbi:hypothetical protein X733_29245 [Mesorhizobium sp. L2C067A000]|nr:hypothetical protein X733_29245 [Mesorhizobium sp. L2C067A000]
MSSSLNCILLVLLFYCPWTPSTIWAVWRIFGRSAQIESLQPLLFDLVWRQAAARSCRRRWGPSTDDFTGTHIDSHAVDGNIPTEPDRDATRLQHELQPPLGLPEANPLLSAGLNV